MTRHFEITLNRFPTLDGIDIEYATSLACFHTPWGARIEYTPKDSYFQLKSTRCGERRKKLQTIKANNMYHTDMIPVSPIKLRVTGGSWRGSPTSNAWVHPRDKGSSDIGSTILKVVWDRQAHRNISYLWALIQQNNLKSMLPDCGKCAGNASDAHDTSFFKWRRNFVFKITSIIGCFNFVRALTTIRVCIIFHQGHKTLVKLVLHFWQTTIQKTKILFHLLSKTTRGPIPE